MRTSVCTGILGAFLLVALIAAPAHAALLAADDANNYSTWNNDSTGANAGFGFDPWVLRRNPGSGFAGFFLATSSNADNSIGTGPSQKAWGTFANGTGFQDAVAYRGFEGGRHLFPTQQFKITIDNGSIQTNGSMGIVLRNGNTSDSTSDYNVGSRFEFFFLGGQSGYRIVDGLGTTVTSIPFTSAGLDLTFTLKHGDLYDLTVFRRSTSETFNFTDRPLRTATAGLPIHSVAMYNRDTESANVYFNNLQVIPEPSTFGIMGLAGLALRRRRCAVGPRHLQPRVDG